MGEDHRGLSFRSDGIYYEMHMHIFRMRALLVLSLLGIEFLLCAWSLKHA